MNGRSCIIQYKYKEFCQLNQFCNGTYDNIHSLPIEKKNSSSNISLPETPTNNAIELKEQSLESIEKSIGNHATLETRLLELDNNNKKRLILKLEKGRSGQKFFEINLEKLGQFTHFRHILVPEDAYAFLRALDVLIVELASENFEEKLQTLVLESTLDADHLHQHKLKLRSVEVIGLFHKFNLELVLFPNTDKLNSQKQICFGLFAEHKVTNDRRRGQMALPLQALPWLRKQMTEMLAKYDGTEQIEMEAPAQIPKKLLARDVSRFPSTGIQPKINIPKDAHPAEKQPKEFTTPIINSKIEEIANLEKELKEMSKEMHEMMKEINGLNKEMANIWKEIDNGKKKNGTEEEKLKIREEERNFSTTSEQ